MAWSLVDLWWTAWVTHVSITDEAGMYVRMRVARTTSPRTGVIDRTPVRHDRARRLRVRRTPSATASQPRSHRGRALRAQRTRAPGVSPERGAPPARRRAPKFAGGARLYSGRTTYEAARCDERPGPCAGTSALRVRHLVAVAASRSRRTTLLSRHGRAAPGLEFAAGDSLHLRRAGNSLLASRSNVAMGRAARPC
jgi:hypothetical protein